jgi:hypothetical protein
MLVTTRASTREKAFRCGGGGIDEQVGRSFMGLSGYGAQQKNFLPKSKVFLGGEKQGSLS